VINNAARDDRHDIEAFSEAEWDANQAVNMKPVFFVIQAALPFLRKAGGGSIINFSSIAFLLNMGELPSYTAAKAGIIGLTKALAGRLGPENIRVNAILPGMVVTERQRQLWLTDDSIAEFQKKQCLKRTLTADDMVGPVLFLASASSGAMTAQTMIVDGGVL
jgi:galactose dehydrogenase